MTQANQMAAKSWVLALTSVASFMMALDALVVTTALSTIRVDLGASIEALEWVVNAYNLSFAVLLLTGAALGDRFGRRRVFAAGLALFVAASAACALADGAGWLIAARAVQGAGAALVMPMAMTLLSATFPPQERGKALGMFSGVTGLALIAGPVVGGAVAEGLAWPWIFWINLPIGLIILLVHRRIPESVGSGIALDIRGLVLVTGAALGVVWGLMRGNGAGWASPSVVAPLVAGLALAVAFVVCEQRTRDPMVPMRLFRSRAFSSGIASSFLFYASMYGVVFLLPQFLQVAQGNGAAWRRVAAAALDRDAVRIRANRRRSHQPHRRAVAHRRWPLAAGNRDRLDRADRHPGPCLRKARHAPPPRRRRRVDGDAGRPERRIERRLTGRDRQGLRHF